MSARRACLCGRLVSTSPRLRVTNKDPRINQSQRHAEKRKDHDARYDSHHKAEDATDRGHDAMDDKSHQGRSRDDLDRSAMGNGQFHARTSSSIATTVAI